MLVADHPSVLPIGRIRPPPLARGRFLDHQRDTILIRFDFACTMRGSIQKYVLYFSRAMLLLTHQVSLCFLLDIPLLPLIPYHDFSRAMLYGISRYRIGMNLLDRQASIDSWRTLSHLVPHHKMYISSLTFPLLGIPSPSLYSAVLYRARIFRTASP